MRSEARVVITNPTGLHARPAVKLAQLAAGFDANVEIRAGDDGEWVRARSTARVMKLKAGAQSTIHLRAEGSQADDALSALVAFVRRDFDEGPAAAPGSETSEESGEAARDGATVSGAAAGEPPDHHAGPEFRARSEAGLGSAAERMARARTDSDRAPHEGSGSSSAAEGTPGDRTFPAQSTSRGGRTISAVVASPGLAIGVLHVPASSRGPARKAGDRSAERAAFDGAVTRAIERLRALAGEPGGLARDVIGFQVSLLEDGEFLGPVLAEIDAGVAADRAWVHHLAREIADYESAPTAYLRDRAADLRDLRERVALAFSDDGHRDALPERCIVVADELTPSGFLELDRSRAVAVATYAGSPASHAAMLARAYRVPMLVQLACRPEELTAGTETVVDADRGYLVPAPPRKMRERFRLRIEERRARDREAVKHASRPARTREGTPVQVLLNVDDPVGLAGVDPSHCDGIGLTRTEFLFHGANGLPDEGTQLDCYRRLVAWARGRPVTVRTLDAGGDKPIPGLTMDGESNPFLGLRGVRLSLSRPEVLATQLRALARAAAGGEVKVMVPMVTRPEEIVEVRRLLASEVQALQSRGIEAAAPQLGMMVEVPAAAMTIETFDADFFSIGTNDLTQYVLAAGRDSTAVADLLDPLHPAVLELIARVADAGASTGREVSVCGEMAARPECLSALLEAGIRTFSVPPAALARTKAALAAL